MLQCCLLPRKLSSVSQLPHVQRFIFRPSVALFHRSLWTFSSRKSGGIRENNTGGLCMLFTRREEIWVICFSLWPRIGSQKKGVHVYIYITVDGPNFQRGDQHPGQVPPPAYKHIQAYTTYMCYNYVYSNMYIYIYTYVADIASNQAFIYMNTSWKPILISTNHFLSKLVVKLVSWKHDTN